MSSARGRRPVPPAPEAGPLPLEELRALPEALVTVWAVLATEGHPGHYAGCRQPEPGPLCLRPCQDAQLARAQVDRLIAEALARRPDGGPPPA
jgi:hypothetical protein